MMRKVINVVRLEIIDNKAITWMVTLSDNVLCRNPLHGINFDVFKIFILD